MRALSKEAQRRTLEFPLLFDVPTTVCGFPAIGRRRAVPSGCRRLTSMRRLPWSSPSSTRCWRGPPPEPGTSHNGRGPRPRDQMLRVFDNKAGLPLVRWRCDRALHLRNLEVGDVQVRHARSHSTPGCGGGSGNRLGARTTRPTCRRLSRTMVAACCCLAAERGPMVCG
jgi:hypothetical protein